MWNVIRSEINYNNEIFNNFNRLLCKTIIKKANVNLIAEKSFTQDKANSVIQTFDDRSISKTNIISSCAVDRSEEARKSYFTDLPTELIMKIFEYLNFKELRSVKYQCKLFNDITEVKYLKERCKKNTTQQNIDLFRRHISIIADEAKRRRGMFRDYSPDPYFSLTIFFDSGGYITGFSIPKESRAHIHVEKFDLILDEKNLCHSTKWDIYFIFSPSYKGREIIPSVVKPEEVGFIIDETTIIIEKINWAAYRFASDYNTRFRNKVVDLYTAVPEILSDITKCPDYKLIQKADMRLKATGS